MKLLLALTVVAVLALALAPRAYAQSSEDQQARALFDAARTAYEAGRFEQALRYFREAYDLSHRPALLFNIASAADRLLEVDQALEAYRAYLAAVPDAENRELAQSRITFLETRRAGGGGGGGPEPGSVEPAHVESGGGQQSSDGGGSGGGGGDITGEWWFWTLIAVLVVGAGVGITAGIVVGTSGQEGPIEGDVRVSMALVEWK